MRLNQLNEERYRKHFYLISILILTLTVLSVFQNCAPVVENSSNMSSGNGLPFGYDTKVDAFGYMSCTGVPESASYSRGYFTYRVTANTAANGLKMSQAFISATPSANALKRSQLLAEQGTNGSAQLNFMVRQRNNYNKQVAKNYGHATHQEGTDFDNIMRPLGDPAIALPIAQAETSSPGSRVQFFSGLPTEAERRFEGSVRFGTYMATETSIRNLFSSYVAALGYIDGSDPNVPYALSNHASNNEKIYGLGYQPSFGPSFARTSATDGTPRPYPSATNPPRIINGITTFDMSTGNQAAESWSCQAAGGTPLALMVVRSADLLVGAAAAGKVTCNAALADSNDAITAAVRKVLPGTHWKIDIGNRCVVAIDPGTAAPSAGVDVCYGGTNLPPTAPTPQTSFLINYTGTFGPAADPAACGYNLDSTPVVVGTGAAQKHVLCPNYVSVCIRN